MSDRRIVRYVVSGRKYVSGWFPRVDAELFYTLMLTQLRLGVTGDAMEIGVHHGRSFITLSLCLGDREKAIAIDIFDQQHLNIDRSGRGNRDRFERNLQRYGEASKTKIVSGSSLDIAPDDIRSFSSGLRFVSIDGGHWYGAVMNDLNLAASCAGPDCVIAIDDIFNPDFPEVSAAYYSWCVSNPDFIPFCISRGKLYTYRGVNSKEYYKALADNKHLKFHCKKTSILWGTNYLFLLDITAASAASLGNIPAHMLHLCMRMLRRASVPSSNCCRIPS